MYRDPGRQRDAVGPASSHSPWAVRAGTSPPGCCRRQRRCEQPRLPAQRWIVYITAARDLGGPAGRPAWGSGNQVTRPVGSAGPARRANSPRGAVVATEPRAPVIHAPVGMSAPVRDGDGAWNRRLGGEASRACGRASPLSSAIQHLGGSICGCWRSFDGLAKSFRWLRPKLWTPLGARISVRADRRDVAST